MHKLLIFLLLLCAPCFLFGQARSLIFLQSSTSVRGDLKNDISYVKNPVFRHENAILSCDSAVFYKARNFFEAYNNVHITQGDTINIYSKFLTYDGNQKLAHLTENVRMLTPTSTLTTNVLDYRTDTKIAQYYDGGKIVNPPDVTITSRKGWYFANSRDAYFRFNVLVVTPQSRITSDTLRYNTFSNWAYFYGPTNIKGKDDNLYTENGAYNTKIENAYFGKKNLYTNGGKSLKGDSLYYYGKRGYGRAVKNIVFIDTEDKMLLRGQLGEYYKADEKVVVTKNAYVGMDSKDSITVNNKKIPDTLWLGADTLEAQKVLQKTLKLLTKPTVQKDSEIGLEEQQRKQEKAIEKAEAKKAMQADEKANATSLGPVKRLSKKEKKALVEQRQRDALALPLKIADSLLVKTKIAIKDSLTKDSVLNLSKLVVVKDSLKMNTKGKAKRLSTAQKVAAAKMVNAKITLPNGVIAIDTLKGITPADTVRTRVIKAYHNVRVYKSNMQALADSLFYTAADSALRWYKSPILWSEGSQQTGDTINVFFKNNKAHSFQIFQNGFIVNVETDSTKFNQVKGRKITGFFVDGSMKDMFVDGNAESIYYTKNDKDEYDNMNQSVSSRIKFAFDKKELTNISMYREIEGQANPIDKLPKETMLTGFIWKPELRPLSKQDIIRGKSAKKAATSNKKSSKAKSIATVIAKKPLATVKKPILTTKDIPRLIMPAVITLTDSLQLDTSKVKLGIKQ